MPKFDSIFFDLDGTICDSFQGIESGIKIALVKSGIDNVNSDLIKKMIGVPLNVSLEKYVFDKDDTNRAKKIGQTVAYFREYYSSVGLFESVLYPNIPDILKELARYSKLYIITAKPTAYAKKIISHHGVEHLFNEIYGFGEEIKFNKAKLINRASPKKNSIMVGDKKQDIAAGKEAGIRTAGVLYGYGSRREIEDSKPNYIVERTDDLIEVLI